MATISQIEKQLASSKKKIAAFEKRIAMYRERVDKAIVSINKAGASVSVDDVILTEKRNGRMVFREFSLPRRIVERFGFEITYRVTSNREALDRAERDLQQEIVHRDSLSLQLERMRSNATTYEQTTQGLAQALSQAMAGFKVVWFRQMRE